MRGLILPACVGCGLASILAVVAGVLAVNRHDPMIAVVGLGVSFVVALGWAALFAWEAYR